MYQTGLIYVLTIITYLIGNKKKFGFNLSEPIEYRIGSKIRGAATPDSAYGLSGEKSDDCFRCIGKYSSNPVSLLYAYGLHPER
jgi:hypothetical protein